MRCAFLNERRAAAAGSALTLGRARISASAGAAHLSARIAAETAAVKRLGDAAATGDYHPIRKAAAALSDVGRAAATLRHRQGVRVRRLTDRLLESTDPAFHARANGIDQQTLFDNVRWHLSNMASNRALAY